MKRAAEEIEETLRTVREKSHWVKPTEKVRACSDPDDDILLECAQTAAAHYLVTGNVKDFPETWAGARIVSPRQFLEVFAEAQRDNPPA